MLLIDTVFVNNGGAKILLDYLIEEVEKSNIKAFFLLDSRIKNNHTKILKNKYIYIKGNYINRLLFYIYNVHKFDIIFCFGNLPPSFKTKVPVYTYLHQALYLKPSNITNIISFKQRLKNIIFTNTIKYSNYFIVQTDSTRNDFLNKYNSILSNNVYILPFYPEIINNSNLRIKNFNLFLYVSDGHFYKNHYNLINAFCNFTNLNDKAELHLTVNHTYDSLCNYIVNKQKLGYKIYNHGILKITDLEKLYNNAEYLIYPSLTESFGLGLIEAILYDCKVLASDLNFVNSVCKPSLKFDPNSSDSIYNALKMTTSTKLDKSYLSTSNKINDLLSLLNN
jgi:hypothetical protein